MSDPGISTLEPLLVFADGKVALEYPLAVYRPDEFLSGRSVRLILITKIENSFLGCVPQAAWDRLVAKRILPRTFFSKAVRVLVKNCREDDRSSVGDSDSVVWLGFVASDMEALVEPSTTEDENVEVDFGEDQLPFAEALVQIAQDHFAFFSAEEEAPGPEAEEPGSENLAERMRQYGDHDAEPQCPYGFPGAYDSEGCLRRRASCSYSQSPSHREDEAEEAEGGGSGPRRGEVPRLGCRRSGGCDASWNRTWSPRGDASLDGEESQRGESVEKSKDGSPGCRPPFRERGGRGRRAWISGWLLGSRWSSIAQAHRDCRGDQERQEEEVWKFKAGDCLRWSYGGAWWRALLIPRRKEVSSGEEVVALHSPRRSRRDLPPHRTAYGRRRALPQPAAGAGSSYVHSPRMGRTSVQDRTVQSGGTLRLGCVRHLRPAEEGKHRWRKSSLLPAPFTIRPSIGRSWKLGPFIRPLFGGFATVQQLISTSSTSGGEWRSSVQQTARPALGGTRPVTSKTRKSTSLGGATWGRRVREIKKNQELQSQRRPPSTRPKQRLPRRPTTTEPLFWCMPYAERRLCSRWWPFTFFYNFAGWKGVYCRCLCGGEFILQVDSENKRGLQEVFAISHCSAQGWDQKPYVEARWRCSFACLADAGPLSWSLLEEGWLGWWLEKDCSLHAGARALLATSWGTWSSTSWD